MLDLDTYNAVVIVSYRITGRIYSININNVSKDQLHKIVKDQLDTTSNAFFNSTTTANKMNEYFDQVEALNPGELVQVVLNGLAVQLTLICWI